MALILYKPLFWASLFVVGVVLLSIARSRHLRWWPAWFQRVALAALVLLALFSPRGELARLPAPSRQVLVIDQSASLDEMTRQQVRQVAEAWQAGNLNRQVIVFGAQPQLAMGPQESWPAVDDRASNPAEALRLAGELLGAPGGEIYLVSDGLTPDSRAVELAAAGLFAHGQRLSIIPLSPRSTTGDVAVITLQSPSSLWEGTPFDLIAQVQAPDGQVPDLHLTINGQESDIEAEALSSTYYRFRIPPQAVGILTLEVRVRLADGPDSLPENDAAFTTLQIFDAPNVLILSLQPDSSQVLSFKNSLRNSGLQVDLIAPQEFTADLSVLEKYRVIFVHNLLAKSFTAEQMAALEIFVAERGGGLVFLGGRYSYTLGGYKDTRLERLLPVKMEPPPRSKRQPILFVLMMDTSSSMSSEFVKGLTVIALAREAAMRSIEILKPEDMLGVLTFSDEPHWLVPVAKLQDGLALRRTLDTISQVRGTGGTNIYRALRHVVDTITNLGPDAPATRNVLLLSDGKSYDGKPGEFESLASYAAQRGITISTIAMGEADQELMSTIAQLSEGRYYAARSPQELPAIMILESQAAQAENIQSGQTGLRLGEPSHPILSGMSEAMLPEMKAYNALASKREQGAEDVLVSTTFGDPILSVWSYSLGRVAAWMGDLGESWSGAWPASDAAGLFWSQVVRYTLSNPALSEVHLDVQVDEGSLLVSADIQDSGSGRNLQSASFSYAGPDGQIVSNNLPRVGVDRYQLEIPHPGLGAFRSALIYQYQDGPRLEQPGSFVVNAPEEFRDLDVAQGEENLSIWAETAGNQAGQGFTTLDALTSPAEQPTSAGLAEMDAWWWRILLALVILWPLEIAIRRRWLPWM